MLRTTVGAALRGRPVHELRVFSNNGRPRRAAPTVVCNSVLDFEANPATAFSYYGLRILSVALTLLLPSVAVIVTGFWPPPSLPVRVVITKVADLLPSGTVTLGGTVAFSVSLLLSVTETPPAGAAPFNVTVPVELAGAVTVVGFTVRFSIVEPSGIVIVAVALFDKAD